MLYFSMVVKNNSLLNILIPNENKTLKEVLKEADIQSLGNTKTTNVPNILKNLFDNITNKTQSNETIQNLLKNSSVFKDLGNFPKELESLVKNLPNEEKMASLKQTLQSFLTNIQDLDENKLKELVQKSGIFLESKINATQNGSALPKLNELLVQIKQLIQNDTSPKAKELNALIDKILTQNQTGKPSATLPNDIKQTITLLKELVQNNSSLNQSKIMQITQQLESLNNNQVKLADSKIEQKLLDNQQKAQLSSEIKPLLNQLKTELTQSKQPLFEPIIKQLDTLIQSKDMFSKNSNSMEPKALMQQLISNPNLQEAAKEQPKINTLLNQLQQQAQQIQKLETAIAKGDVAATKIQELQQQIKSTLSQLQTILNEVKQTDVKTVQPIIDKLISMPNLFSKLDIPPSSNPTPNNSTTNAQAQQNIQQNNSNSALNTQQSTTTKTVADASVLVNNAKTNINAQAQNETAKTPLEIKLTQNTAQSVSDMTQPAKNTLESNVNQELKPVLNNLNENIKSIVTAVKASLAQLQLQNPNQESIPVQNQMEMVKTMQKLETMFQGRFEQLQQQLQQSNKSPADIIKEDIKSALLQLQQESQNNPKMQEIGKQVDRLLTHIDYYQLLSVTSSSNYLYLPFMWDMLEDGNISMKQLQDERYFCEIHLTLKEFGQMDLLLGLSQDNHIDISIFASQDFVKDLIKEYMVELRVGLNKAGLIPQSITVLDLKPQEEETHNPNVYQHNPYNDSDLGFGVDIKV